MPRVFNESHLHSTNIHLGQLLSTMFINMNKTVSNHMGVYRRTGKRHKPIMIKYNILDHRHILEQKGGKNSFEWIDIKADIRDELVSGLGIYV